ncbi:MAG: abortive infection family protein [Actinomycetota bacterium]|nr:abortive infection family protein [Actinomycetota bacterium]
MSRFKTVHQCAEAIGASKELLEATFRGALDLMCVAYGRSDDYPALAKKVRSALHSYPGFAPAGDESKAITKILSGFGQISSGMAEMRNSYGTGHGKPRHPGGLTVRHARLAVDLATAECRFIALSLRDLGLLTGD